MAKAEQERDSLREQHEDDLDRLAESKVEWENLVRSLREQLAESERLIAVVREKDDILRQRLEQLEEALREAWSCIQLRPERFPQGTIERVRNALNPNTESEET